MIKERSLIPSVKPPGHIEHSNSGRQKVTQTYR